MQHSDREFACHARGAGKQKWKRSEQKWNIFLLENFDCNPLFRFLPFGVWMSGQEERDGVEKTNVENILTNLNSWFMKILLFSPDPWVWTV